MSSLKDAEIENTSYSLIGPKIRGNRTIFVEWDFRNHEILIFYKIKTHDFLQIRILISASKPGAWQNTTKIKIFSESLD